MDEGKWMRGEEYGKTKVERWIREVGGRKEMRDRGR
jgi:hypothetical protein